MNKDVVWPIRMPKELKIKFKNHCDEQGYSMNKRMKILIEKDINDGK
jgi:predicted DNA-binding protein